MSAIRRAWRLALRLLSLSLAAVVGGALYYVSRFWNHRLWDRDGLFGIEALRPQGDLVRVWLRGTELAPYDILVWGALSIVALSLLERILSFLHPPTT